MEERVDGIYGLPIGHQIVRYGLTLTLTEDGWRAEVQHSMMRRCEGWDYCKPWTYLITIGCQHHDIVPEPEVPQATVPEGWQYPVWLREVYAKGGRPHLFGELTGNTEQEADIALNPFGLAVQGQIRAIEQEYPQIEIYERKVMPNHIHMVLRVKERLPEKKPLGIVLKDFKSWVNRTWKGVCLGLPVETRMDLRYQLDGRKAKARMQAQQAGWDRLSSPMAKTTIQSTPYQPKRHGTHPDIGLVFESGFNDRILFRQGQLRNMIDYCRDNPRRLWLVVHNSKYFHTVSGIRLTMPLLNTSGTKGQRHYYGPMNGLLAPIQYTPIQHSQQAPIQHSQQAPIQHSQQAPIQHSQQAPIQQAQQAPIQQAPGAAYSQTVTFNAIGNLELLRVPERMQIQCSRSMSEADIEVLKCEVLEACRHGVVPISPCISPGERAVARAVMEAGYNLIALFPQGIPEDTTYKPYKEYFDACANGQLLLLSPWRYENGVKHISRPQCLFLNDIAMQLMVGEN